MNLNGNIKHTALIFLLISIFGFDIFGQAKVDRLSMVRELAALRAQNFPSDGDEAYNCSKLLDTFVYFYKTPMWELLDILSSKEKWDAAKFNKRLKYSAKSRYSRYQFSENSVQLLHRNLNLLELIYEEIVYPIYPFRLNVDSSFLADLEFYGINKNDIVADIGAGIGSFSYYLASIFSPRKIVLNEINKYYFKFYPRKFRLIDSTHTRIHWTLGSKEKTNLEEHTYSKIIIKNAVHHFKRLPEMMQSINNNLTQNGTLIIEDYIINTPGEEGLTIGCARSPLQFEELEKTLNVFGFLLIDYRRNGTKLLYKYKKA